MGNQLYLTFYKKKKIPVLTTTIWNVHQRQSPDRTLQLVLPSHQRLSAMEFAFNKNFAWRHLQYSVNRSSKCSYSTPISRLLHLNKSTYPPHSLNIGMTVSSLYRTNSNIKKIVRNFI